MCLGICGHYWSSPRYGDFYDGETSVRGGLRWGSVLLGVIFAAGAALSGYLAYISN